ncbi:Translocase inner membrane subunit 8 [Theobroma cacao]|uniref:Translocase inner membrane subunit 8 n=1 Tax=Theobroma cacao TaxID=3641 RepID=A0A061G069_THECC|nr:Translocase inner membrane subunit 8 [Theobroma cacao]
MFLLLFPRNVDSEDQELSPLPPYFTLKIAIETHYCSTRPQQQKLHDFYDLLSSRKTFNKSGQGCLGFLFGGGGGGGTSIISFWGLNEGFRLFVFAAICEAVLRFNLLQMDPSLNSAELQRFLNQEKEKAMVNEMVAKLTSVCWDKCITSTPGSKFSSSESACLSHCAQRYMDMSLIIMKRFQSMQ